MSKRQVNVTNENILVGVRVRPLVAREIRQKEQMAWSVNSETNTICQQKKRNNTRSKNKAFLDFPFNKAYGPESSTREVYEGVMKDMILSAVQGINGTIFAYGQTSSGKTFTMKGSPEEQGIISMSINEVFKAIRDTPDREFLLRTSYLEIYNEEIRDLLNTDRSPPELSIKESKSRGVFVKNAHEEIVTSVSEVLDMMSCGEKQRHYGKTKMNDLSSRSHTILTLTIESKALVCDNSRGHNGKVRVSTLHFVDLAGSERMAQAGTKGQRAKEGMHINKSLLFLGVVISRLSEGEKYIPFRDSKLTRMLQSSLGGNSRTAIICNVSPALSNLDHTISTLRFGSRAIKIQNHAHINEVTSESAMLNQHYTQIINMTDRVTELESNEAENAAELKQDLELQLTHLRNLILKNTSPTADVDAVQDGNTTVALTKKKGRRHKSLGYYSQGGVMFAAQNNTEPDHGMFRSEQSKRLQDTNQKLTDANKSLDGLLTELSAENNSILSQLLESEHEHEVLGDIISELKEEATTLHSTIESKEQNITALELQVSQLSGSGLNVLSDAELGSMEATLWLSLKSIMRQRERLKAGLAVEAENVYTVPAAATAMTASKPVVAAAVAAVELEVVEEPALAPVAVEPEEDEEGEVALVPASYEDFSKALEERLSLDAAQDEQETEIEEEEEELLPNPAETQEEEYTADVSVDIITPPPVAVVKTPLKRSLLVNKPAMDKKPTSSTVQKPVQHSMVTRKKLTTKIAAPKTSLSSFFM
jgi:centromeric protein E